MFLLLLALSIVTERLWGAAALYLLPLLHLTWARDWKRLDQSNAYVSGVSFCLLLAYCGLSPVFENDFHRYFYDGLHAAKGLAVYATPPSESPFNASLPSLINKVGFPEERTVYSPPTLSLFALLVTLANHNPEVFYGLLKALALLSTLGFGFLFFRQKNNPQPGRRAIFLCLHPLILLETIRNLHFDYIIGWLIVAQISASRPWQPVLLALATSFRAQILPLFLLETFKNRSLPSICLFCLSLFFATVLPWILFDLSFADWIENLQWMRWNWEMNSGAFRWFRRAIFSLSNDAFLAIEGSYFIGGALILLAAGLLLKARRTWAEKLIYMCWAIQLLLPVVNPWYFVPIGLMTSLLCPHKVGWFSLKFAILSSYYIFFLLPGQLEAEPGLWLDFEHIALWAVTALSFRARNDLEPSIQIFLKNLGRRKIPLGRSI